jgi:hypothetical protein
MVFVDFANAIGIFLDVFLLISWVVVVGRSLHLIGTISLLDDGEKHGADGRTDGELIYKTGCMSGVNWIIALLHLNEANFCRPF